MSEGVFVDWLTVSQYHGEGTRELVGGLTFKYDDKGEPLAEAGHPRKLLGSHRTSLMVRSHGGRVTVSGNPSRWNRPDNLFGYGLDECMDIINRELVKLRLPVFSAGEEMSCNVRSIDGFHGLPEFSGATFSHIDLTRNFEAGSDLAARLAIKAYSARAGKYMRKSVYGEETAMFHNTRRTIKAYRKGPDMAVHAKESPWGEWAMQRGIVRHEVSVKYRYLHDTGLRFWGNLDMGKLIRLFEKETAVLGSPEVQHDPIELGLLERPARVTYAAWLKGTDVRSLLSRATFFRHRKALLAHGVDIAEVRPFAEATPIVRVVDLVPARAPAGYWQQAA